MMQRIFPDDVNLGLSLFQRQKYIATLPSSLARDKEVSDCGITVNEDHPNTLFRLEVPRTVSGSVLG